MKKSILILQLFCCMTFYAQKDTSKYDRLEEVIDLDKRYALHNNYLSAGFGLSYSNVRDKEQSTLGIDYVFHIRREHFQVGFLMSGNEFLSNNNLQGHIGYGYRKENEKYNIAFFGGPSISTGVLPPKYNATDTIPAHFYEAFGFYGSAAYIHKLAYDIGIGLEAIIEVNTTQVFGGVKAVLFFSGAYRGKAKVFNRHVKRRRLR